MELLLLKEGVPLDAVAPTSEVHTVEEERHDTAASLARLSPTTVRAMSVGTITLGVIALVETGLWTPLAVAVAAAVGIEQIRDLDAPDSVTKTHKVTRGGLPEQKLMRYLVMSNELQKMETEEREKARKKAEGRQNARSAMSGRRF